MPLRATDVFTPNDFPAHTYVNRSDDRLEQRLSEALETPKTVISISGPSKSGKTVLVEKMVGKDNLIVVSGAEIDDVDGLWARVLDWMGAPSTLAAQDQTQSATGVAAKISATVGLPLFSKTGELSGSRTKTSTSGTTKTYNRGGLSQVVKDIAESDFVVLVDDFHYMQRALQTEAAKQIKTAAERGIRICVASVPHRSDDVVRSNSELRGRTINLDTKFWLPEELALIGTVGFGKLNVHVEPETIVRFASEACGSPQIMQTICLQTCFKIGAREGAIMTLYPRIDGAVVEEILEEAALRSDYSSLVVDMHQGPKTRGTERKDFNFKDGSKGDVYRAVLLALTADPPIMSIPYPDLMQRIRAVCISETPVGRSVTETCEQIVKFAEGRYPEQRIVEFDGAEGSDTFSVVDPYWLFYARSSTKLDKLGGL